MTAVQNGKPKGRAPGRPFKRSTPSANVADYLATYLAELAELERTTDPAGGRKTARGKDKKAMRALTIAGRVVTAVAGWAINHQVGLGIAGLSPVRQTKEPLPGKSYLKAELAKVDRHDHEIVGADSHELGLGLSPAARRRALVNLFEGDPGGFRPRLTHSAKRALRALEYNEVLPIFQPVKNKRKVSLSMLDKQRMAVLFVEHRVFQGMKRYEAIEVVARAFNVGPETLRSWKARLRREFGPLAQEVDIQMAKNPSTTRLYDDRSLERVAKSIARHAKF